MTTTSTRSLPRLAVITTAALLLALAHAGAVAAQTTTRYVRTCFVEVASGVAAGSCELNVPSGKVFVIESATAWASTPSSNAVTVQLITTLNGAHYKHTFHAGFQVLSNSTTKWNGMLPGTVFSEEGPMTVVFSRQGPYGSGAAQFRVTLSGRLEDM